jgi:hypothetical protein
MLRADNLARDRCLLEGVTVDPLYRLIAPDRATGIWATDDVLRRPDGAPIPSLHGYGHYHETCEKHREGEMHGDGWLIAPIRLTRLRFDLERTSQ